uniref:actin-associated protein FAM107A isoform X2 n=1 Tax=Ictidomys tridecemlineatus TaxID=43179 RepID=UPI001A9FFADB|nr:actin-associated protein FAM107A isoform X2 [Ictidomys tridecemlineatus]
MRRGLPGRVAPRAASGLRTALGRRPSSRSGTSRWSVGPGDSARDLPSPGPRARTSMYSEIQRERADIGGLMARPEYREWNPELIKPKKLLNPVKASRSHQELHRELLMNHRRGLGVDSKPELQRVLEHRRRNQLIKKKKEELEAKRLQCPFEQELLRRQQRLNQLEKPPEKEEEHAPEFIKVRENLRRIATLGSEERAL